MDKQEAIKILKEFHDKSAVFSVRTALETVLPELEESEDEKIRKAILNYFTKCWGNCKDDVCGIHVEDAIAWLEKQRKPIDDNIITRDDEILQAISVGLTDAVEDFGWSDFGGLPIEEIQEWLEKQGEQSSIIEMKSPEESLGISSKEYNDVVNECLYGESKSTEQTDPKFKVGDWVVYDHRPYQVVELPKKGHINLGLRRNGKIEFAPSPYCRHWTIQDAKDGDVLSNGKLILIFKHFEDSSYSQHIVAYIGLDNKGDIQITDDTWSLGVDKAKPATKEQLDLLFAKMKEAGYEWNDVKKELKKVGQEPSLDEEDIRNIENIDAVLFYDKDLPEDTCMRLRNWLKSLKQRMKGE